MEQKPLTELTDQELQAEFKKKKQAQIAAAFVVGMSAGVAFWAIMNKGNYWFAILPIVMAYLSRNASKDLKEVKKEMEARKIS
ncbi:MAG: hypothetical protein MUF58_04550 [Arcicella sp.]|jgi:hypothetical protein|nr:hypothetical protein [Arcicella sp.]